MEYCVITGAAGGIGSALVEKYTDAGYGVIAIDSLPRPKNLNCKDYIQCDLYDLVNNETYAIEKIGKIRDSLNGYRMKVLINNAAIQILGSAKDLTRKDWHQTIDINLLAPFFLAQAFLVDLELSHGCVINISSIHADHTKKNFAAYSTSKAALSGLTRSLAIDLAGRVRVLGIEPAAIETKMLKSGFQGNLEAYNLLNKGHPIGRIGQAEEVANLAVALVNGGMDFINGVSIRIDGGISSQLFEKIA